MRLCKDARDEDPCADRRHRRQTPPAPRHENEHHAARGTEKNDRAHSVCIDGAQPSITKQPTKVPDDSIEGRVPVRLLPREWPHQCDRGLTKELATGNVARWVNDQREPPAHLILTPNRYAFIPGNRWQIQRAQEQAQGAGRNNQSKPAVTTRFVQATVQSFRQQGWMSSYCFGSGMTSFRR